MASQRIYIDILSRRDPHGYYVIPAEEDARDLVLGNGILVIDVGDGVLIKTRSRSQAVKILKLLQRRGLLKINDDDDAL